MPLTRDSRVWMVGAGIATMSAASFLIRDAGLPGSNIHFLEQINIVGGSMDGGRSRVPGSWSRVPGPGFLVPDEQKLLAYDRPLSRRPASPGPAHPAHAGPRQAGADGPRNSMNVTY